MLESIKYLVWFMVVDLVWVMVVDEAKLVLDRSIDLKGKPILREKTYVGGLFL